VTGNEFGTIVIPELAIVAPLDVSIVKEPAVKLFVL